MSKKRAQRLSNQLIEIAGLTALDETKMKQFIEMCVRAIMEEEGYELAETGIWLGNDPLFSTGATYRKSAGPVTANGDDFFERFVGALSDAEVERLSALVAGRRK